MNNQTHTQPAADQQPEERQEKQSYTTPTLKKLGTVQELTRGDGRGGIDVALASA